MSDLTQPAELPRSIAQLAEFESHLRQLEKMISLALIEEKHCLLMEAVAEIIKVDLVGRMIGSCSRLLIQDDSERLSKCN